MSRTHSLRDRASQTLAALLGAVLALLTVIPSVAHAVT